MRSSAASDASSRPAQSSSKPLDGRALRSGLSTDDGASIVEAAAVAKVDAEGKLLPQLERPMDTLAAELRQAWNQITYLSLALIVSAWTIGVFGISCLVEEGDDDGAKKPPRRKQFLKTHVV